MTHPLPDGRRLILASTSKFRRELLIRLALPFDIRAPDTDETPEPAEEAQVLVRRLAKLKAQSVAYQEPYALVIGSDQAAVLGGDILGKPGDHQQALAQLSRSSGKALTFYTGLCLIDSDSGRTQTDAVPFRVVFRTLNLDQIERYLHRERPYQCAGSFKSEGLGISLCERLAGDDPTSLIGLPLIRLTQMLESEGIIIP